MVFTACAVVWGCSYPWAVSVAAQSTPKAVSATASIPPAGQLSFDSPQSAADALVKAPANFDEIALTRIFGPDGKDIVFTGEFPQDRKDAANFADEAREKLEVSVEPKTGNRAYLLVGDEHWPFPVPLVKKGAGWSFDSKAGREELVYRRIGADELDAIEICRGYVEAQEAYSFETRQGYDVNQYAQRIISTPGTQDGLAWKNSDGTWGGPIGEKIAQAIEQGYSLDSEPYHGYFFKILKGQGPAAPLGEMNFMVKGVMIGGFALVATPAEYGVTGVQTFIVSHDDEFKKMELFNPDDSWIPVPEQDESTPANNVSDTTIGLPANPPDLLRS